MHYGTDFVFDGLADRPYTEEDEPAPQSVYACSKLLGEWFAADCPRHYVLRVESLFGGSQRRSSVDRIVDAIRNGQPARVFVDRTVTPSYVRDVAAATWRLLETGAAPGVYHCVNSGVTTWFELAKEIGRLLGVEPDLVPVKVADVPMRARRPQYAALVERQAGARRHPDADVAGCACSGTSLRCSVAVRCSRLDGASRSSPSPRVHDELQTDRDHCDSEP